MNKNNDIGKLLRDRLGDFHAEPPGGMFDRIERSLADVSSRESSAGVPRRSRSLQRWRYAVAAGLMFMVAGGGYLLLQKRGEVVYGPSSAVVLPDTAGDRTDMDGGDAVEVAESNHVAADGHAEKALAGRWMRNGTYISDSPPPASGDDLPDAGGGEEKDNPSKIVQGNENGAAGRPGTPGSGPGGGSGSGTQMKSQPGQQRIKAVAGDSGGARSWSSGSYLDGSQRRLRRGRASVSLYAVNTPLGGGDDSRSNSGYNTKFQVTENIRMAGLEHNGGISQTVGMEAEAEHRMPVTVGVDVSWRLSRGWSIQSGIIYTHLRSKWEVSNMSTYSMTQDLHYLGVPLSVSCRLLGGGGWNLYARAGGAAERGVAGTLKRSTSIEGGMSGSHEENVPMDGAWQFSLGAALGVAFDLSKRIALYAEPGVGYYFENDSQPESYYTENRVGFNLRAGVRFNL